MTKKQSKHGKNHAQYRSRQTRSSRGRLVLQDPAENSQLLSEQLRALGLYAAPTMGDGNCLFRALSDQVYGSESRHAHLRKDICDWISDHKSRYAPFVEDERGLDVHLRCMRENATYGGHLELSAFAHLFRRNIKVVQPGLVYIIEWDAGGEPSSDEESRSRHHQEPKYPSFPLDDDDDAEPQTIYVAYHDWEHFSSIRNLRGPHSGLPIVSESPYEPTPTPAPPPTQSSPKKLPKVKLKLSSAASSRAATPAPQSSTPAKVKSRMPIPLPVPRPLPAETVPLPVSRSPSPAVSTLSGRDASSSASSSSSPPSQDPTFPPISISGDPPKQHHFALPPSTASSLAPPQRMNRSPKRSIDDSDEAASNSSGGPTKRSRSSLARTPSPISSLTDSDEDDRMDDIDDTGGSHTPALTTASSEEEEDSEELSSEEVTTPPPPPPPPRPTRSMDKPLTRRQRKSLGLPKARAVQGTVSAGTIKIPGGRYRQQQQSQPDQQGAGTTAAATAAAAGLEEWQRNGIGRVDVRGFRELKI